LEVDAFETPDIEALAAQLGDDAAYLAKLYPPRAMPTQLLERRRRWSASTTVRWRVAAAVLCLAGTASALGAWGLANRREALQVALAPGSSEHQSPVIAAPAVDPTHDNEQSSDVSTSGVLPAAAAPMVRDANSNHVSIVSDFSGLEPGDLLRDLSVPEQEAVFDLLESEPIELARISL
jgi:hypothetical protein